MFEIAAYFLGSLILFIMVFFIASKDEEKKEKIRNSFLKNKPIAEFDCDLIDGIDKVQATLLATNSFYRTHASVMLYEKSIVIATGSEVFQPEIMINDIEAVSMKRLAFDDHLYIRHTVTADIKARYKETCPEIYLKGKKEDLLYIKKFLEERMHRPQVIDLTGGDQTEQ